MMAGRIVCPLCGRDHRVRGRREGVLHAVLARWLREHIVKHHGGEVIP